MFYQRRTNVAEMYPDFVVARLVFRQQAQLLKCPVLTNEPFRLRPGWFDDATNVRPPWALQWCGAGWHWEPCVFESLQRQFFASE